MKRSRVLAVLLLVAVGPLGCGGGGSGDESTGGPPSPSSGTISPGNASFLDECADAPRSELDLPAGWVTCADSGLLPPVDGFLFENWVGPTTSDTFTPSLAVSMFGESAVCMDTSNGCVLYPAAQQWIDQMNLAIEGGRCEGMAVLSQRFLEGRDEPVQFQPGAATAADLNKEELTVGSTIARWWASQTFPAVRAATAPTLEWTPLEIAARVAEAIRAGEGATIGLYGDGAAHAVTPIAVSTDGADQVVVHVYDNNFPGRILPVQFDRVSDTWRYDVAGTSPGVASEVWSGGVGTIDLTLMSEREIAVPAPWSDDSTTKGSTVLTVTTGGSTQAGLELDFGGEVVDTLDPSRVRDGVSVYPFRGARRGTGAVVVVEPSAGGFSVRPKIGATLDRTATELRLLVTIDLPGRTAVQIGGRYPIGAETELPNVVVDEVGDSGLGFRVDGAGEFLVDLAYGEEGFEFDLNGETEVSFVDDGDSIDLEVVSSDGDVVWEGQADGEVDGESFVETDIEFDDESGEFTESSDSLDGFVLDAALLGWIVDTLRETLDEWAAILGDDFDEFFGQEFLDEFAALMEQLENETWPDDTWVDDTWPDDTWVDDTWVDETWPEETWPDETWPEEDETVAP